MLDEILQEFMRGRLRKFGYYVHVVIELLAPLDTREMRFFMAHVRRLFFLDKPLRRALPLPTWHEATEKKEVKPKLVALSCVRWRC